MAESKEFENVYNAFTDRFGGQFDVFVGKIRTVKGGVMLCYLNGFIDSALLAQSILPPLKSAEFSGDIINSLGCIVTEAKDEKEFVGGFFGGLTGIYFEGKFYLADIVKIERRGVQPPDAENLTRGAKEGFSEDVFLNSSLLRRRLKTPNLVMEEMTLGKQSRTVVLVAYLQDTVNNEVLERVRNRLLKIDVDAVLESGKIEQLIEQKGSLISGVGLTQRPDVCAARILEGRVAVICDGTPHVLTVPELFVENIHSAEDYYGRPIFATFMRLLRLCGLVISILLPGLAVAVFTFHQEMLPKAFLAKIILSVANTPFPEAVEIFFLMMMLELLKESGARLPKNIGSSVSIIGGLIIGDAAVGAGIISAPTVIVVALTAIASFIVPGLNELSTVCRFAFLALGAAFGLMGIGAGVMLLLLHLCSVSSFGIPVMSFFRKNDLKDTVIRFPLEDLKFRPTQIARNNLKRIGD